MVITSARERVFCSGANIFMLGVSSHAWKVNFCKFTNETRNGLEDSSKYDGLKFLAAVNGSCAGGGYELALACDEIILIDDRSSAVSLPEVPLLGVLPGTGGLTRLTDKRHVRHDLADVFCTTSEGVRGEKALDWRLVDAIAKPAQFAGQGERARARARRDQRPPGVGERRRADADRAGHRSRCACAIRTSQVTIDRAARAATFTIKGPSGPAAARRRRDRGAGRGLVSAGARPRARGRDPVDAHQRARHRRVADQDRGRARGGAGDGRDARRAQGALARARDHRLSAPHLQPARRHLAQPVRARRRGLVLRRHAVRDWHSLATASTISRCPAAKRARPRSRVSAANFGDYPMASGQSRLGRRFYDERPALEAAESRRSASRSTPTRRSPLASPPAFPTTSTGRTRSASRSRSARR